jgi:transcriptional regulator with XRE-family HTH domain
MKPRILAFGEYLAAVERLHAATSEDIAAAAGVSPAEVRRWRRGTRSPGWEAVRTLAARYGGDARLVYLGVVLERFARRVGTSLEEAARLPFSRARPAPLRGSRRDASRLDRRQMSFFSP